MLLQLLHCFTFILKQQFEAFYFFSLKPKLLEAFVATFLQLLDLHFQELVNAFILILNCLHLIHHHVVFAHRVSRVTQVFGGDG